MSESRRSTRVPRSLRDVCTQADADLQAAREALRTLRAEAAPQVLRLRDLEFVVAAGVLPADDEEVMAARQMVEGLRARLAEAINAVGRAEQDLTIAQRRLREREAEIERGQREAWVRVHHPEEAAALDEAQASLEEFYSLDERYRESPAGQKCFIEDNEAFNVAKEKFEELMTQAPAP